jgi:hypothetical protein
MSRRADNLISIFDFDIKMWILPLVGYLGVVVGFAFLTLAIGKF